jgi:hypothetical protein
MLLAYDAAGEVVATLDYMVARGADDKVIGLVDFEAHELGGGALTDVWIVAGAVGSGTWPEWLGERAHDFRVELAPSGVRPKIAALVHKSSGRRRERAAIEAALAPAVADLAGADGQAVQEAAMRTVVAVLGAPGHPLRLDDDGAPLAPPERHERPALPIIGGRRE